MPFTIVGAEYIEIDAVPLSTPAWATLNLPELLQPPPRRGNDRVIPNAAGQRPKRRLADEAKRTLMLLVVGDTDWEANVYTNKRGGLIANIDKLRELTDPDPLVITKTAIVHYLDETGAAATVTGEVIIDGFEWEPWDDTALATLEVTIPAGALA